MCDRDPDAGGCSVSLERFAIVNPLARLAGGGLPGSQCPIWSTLLRKSRSSGAVKPVADIVDVSGASGLQARRQSAARSST